MKTITVMRWSQRPYHHPSRSTRYGVAGLLVSQCRTPTECTCGHGDISSSISQTKRPDLMLVRSTQRATFTHKLTKLERTRSWTTPTGDNRTSPHHKLGRYGTLHSTDFSSATCTDECATITDVEEGALRSSNDLLDSCPVAYQ